MLEFTFYMPRTAKSLGSSKGCIISPGKVIDTKLNSTLLSSKQSMEGSCI